MWDGITFDKAWTSRFDTAYAGLDVHYVGRADLIANKEAAARPQDLLDVAYLRDAEDRDGGA